MIKNSNKNLESQITHKEALLLLKQGNFRFVNALNIKRSHLAMVDETANGQWPFAVIVSCMDSRTSVEFIFDQGLGDVFSLRVAGNIIRDDILGSIEFACKVAGSKLIVVMGHTNCGAIRGACDRVQLGNLTQLLAHIKPAIDAENTILENRNASNLEFVEKVCDLNIHKNIEYILKNSEVLREMVEEDAIAIVAAKYDVRTGIVDFL